ncbi:MAG: ankyrin repeat domain-containing protein [Thermoanaerobaculales bacterium]
MKSLLCLLVFCLQFPIVVFSDEPDRAELLASPRIVDDAAEPAFLDLTAEELKRQLLVISSRSYAYFGFNNSEVQIYLPRCDNSVYASVEFSPARLLDAADNEVEFERVRGIYDHDTHSDELRFAPVEGKEPVEFARVEGSIALRYPVRMRTVAIGPGGAAPTGLTVTIDGPFVSWSDPEKILPEARPFTPVERFRAFDASGRRLEQHSFKGYSVREGVSTEKYAFWGEVAEFGFDVVDEWAELDISYSLPAIDPLPASRSGSPPDNFEVKETPGGTVDIRVRQKKPQVEAVKTKEPQVEAATAEASQDDVLAQLRKFGVRRFDASSFVWAASQGKTEALELFIAAGMPVDTDSYGRTALIAAATMNHVEAGKLLIAAGADVNRSNSTGSTPLHLLVMRCDTTEFLRTLIDAGANLSVKLVGGVSPYKMAKMSNCSENARLLKESGAR